jgi:hypothetical protein
MKRIRHLLLVTLAALGSAACTDDSAPEADAVLERERAALERARDVEDDLLEAADRQRERIDEEGG